MKVLEKGHKATINDKIQANVIRKAWNMHYVPNNRLKGVMLNYADRLSNRV